jgi:predicted transcriptional regulator
VASPKLSKLELKVMDALWKLGAASVREVQEHFPEKDRPAYTTVQTILYRLETKEAVRRTKKISNAHIFETVLTRKAVYRRAVNDLLGLFDGRVGRSTAAPISGRSGWRPARRRARRVVQGAALRPWA